MRPLLIVALLALAGCNTPAVTENPNPPPPPPRAEIVPQSPVTEDALIWQPGHWNWNAGGYVWEPGVFVSAAGHGGQWLVGYWSEINGTWVWLPAHWV